MHAEQQYDVAILGGGLAGLTLALQLKQTRPATHTLVAEKQTHPVPEAAYKVGESTVEVAGHYLGEVLGLKPHLDAEQLPKCGLRYFFPAGDNSDIARRVELGPIAFPPVPSYQLDRGRFENMLRREVQAQGVVFWDDCTVTDVALDDERHIVTMDHSGVERTVAARWVVDATGRAGILKRMLGLTKDVDHHVNAAWFRIEEDIAIDDWSDDPDWCARVAPGLRRYSTNHLMGEGYWVWLIPLSSGSTSIGIVADDHIYPYRRINRKERALDWLAQHEPQCAQIVDAHVDQMQDFRALKHFSYGCERVFSPGRWCLTGEAGVFTDPFYSPGSDFIAYGNSFITGLIVEELAGNDISERAETYNRNYLNMFRGTLRLFAGQYPLMGNAQVMSAKIVWDFATYWGITGLLYFHEKLFDVDFLATLQHDLYRFGQLDRQMAALFADWSTMLHREWTNAFVDLLDVGFLHDLHLDLQANLRDGEVRARLSRNVDWFEAIAIELCRAAGTLCEVEVPASINPYTFQLSTDCTPVESRLDARPSRALREAIATDLDRIWLETPMKPAGSSIHG